jgi:arsenate reductase
MNTLDTRKKILFICKHNSVRSQIAEALINHYYGDRFRAFSAGIKPTFVNPNAIKVMKEIGIDINQQQAKSIDRFKGNFFDVVVTVCGEANETCPFFPAADKSIHHSFKDPSKFKGSIAEITDAFRKTRDEIKSWLEQELEKKDNQ